MRHIVTGAKALLNLALGLLLITHKLGSLCEPSSFRKKAEIGLVVVIQASASGVSAPSNLLR